VISERLATLLASAGIDAFESPNGFFVALALATAATALAARRRPAALGLAAFREARRAGARRIDAVRAGALGLRALALIALAAVLAGPVGVAVAPPEPGRGLDLVLVVDASGSMRALDARDDTGWRTRLELAREVVSRFAEQRAAEGDRVGLVVFGETTFTQCPLTSDGRLLVAALARVEAGMAGEATALGDALGLAVKRALAGAGSSPFEPAGRVIVLLTDGRHNAGALSVEAATVLAAAEGLRVHTVAIGTAGEDVAMETRDRAAAPRFERHDVDLDALARVAETTGGRFFHARRSRDLEAVYAEIDALERVTRPLPARLRRTDRPEPLLAAAGGLLLCELALARVVRRRLP
jgi:Ca-activated chloride channel family protein